MRRKLSENRVCKFSAMSDSDSADSASPSAADFVVICGETVEGKKFRPSDWCDRLHSTLRALDAEDYEECAEYVHLINSGVGKGVRIDRRLQKINPMLFNFFMNFVKSNNLAVAPDKNE